MSAHPGDYLNRGPHATHATMLMDLHYAQLDLRTRWDRERFYRLCGYLRLTEWELASMLSIPHSTMSHVIGNKFKWLAKPDNGPLLLLLTMIESTYLGGLVPDVLPSVMPMAAFAEKLKTTQPKKDSRNGRPKADRASAL